MAVRQTKFVSDHGIRIRDVRHVKKVPWTVCKQGGISEFCFQFTLSSRFNMWTQQSIELATVLLSQLLPFPFKPRRLRRTGHQARTRNNNDVQMFGSKLHRMIPHGRQRLKTGVTGYENINRITRCGPESPVGSDSPRSSTTEHSPLSKHCAPYWLFKWTSSVQLTARSVCSVHDEQSYTDRSVGKRG